MASETALYAAVKAFLEAQGFAAKGEVGGCDVVAVRAGEPPVLVVCELKLGFTLDLLLQAADRMAVADAVWLAVPRSQAVPPARAVAGRGGMAGAYRR